MKNNKLDIFKYINFTIILLKELLKNKINKFDYDQLKKYLDIYCECSDYNNKEIDLNTIINILITNDIIRENNSSNEYIITENLYYYPTNIDDEKITLLKQVLFKYFLYSNYTKNIIKLDISRVSPNQKYRIFYEKYQNNIIQWNLITDAALYSKKYICNFNKAHFLDIDISFSTFAIMQEKVNNKLKYIILYTKYLEYYDLNKLANYCLLEKIPNSLNVKILSINNKFLI